MNAALAGDRRVLVVDDNPVVVDLLRFSLESVGVEVATAGTGREALELLQEQSFAVVVTDYQMPDIDGRALCEQLRREPRWADMPVVLLTAKTMELDCARLREELGVCEVFAKPFSPRELTQTVTSYLG